MTLSSMDSPSTQLQSELDASTHTAFDASVGRPILKHLNADSSWLLSLPYPEHILPPSGRCRYNIVIDVWLRGPQVDLFSWFSSQEHAKPSAIQSFAELNDLLCRAETAVVGAQPEVQQAPYFIDAVCCSHEFTDHCHEATLKELPAAVPVFAPKKAANLVRSWKHFEYVEEVPVYQSGYDWHVAKVSRLPSWVGIGRIHTKGDAPIYFHSALMITFALSTHGEEEAEAIVYTPHGVDADSLAVVKQGKYPTKVLALFHGLHDISLAGAQLNLGMQNAIKAREILDARYWTPTHDEQKVAHGLVASFLKRVVHTLPMAPGSHPVTRREEGKPDTQRFNVCEKSFVELQNGESLVLE
ncbi:hypothetical protein LTR70_003208 [Exophiala xenobiotica]|uniref:Uncharacterized protein n=1 Tax=Lithohypha guttulata TaxID=1690604 RepID=A0ABR0KGM4_9EURO|nr:hypothetical protein LTR24_002853 [Lithohypha guttulata]KAK5323720.1 hypothetical protein LTR70_003208 [Exophiala xenobiotica]